VFSIFPVIQGHLYKLHLYICPLAHCNTLELPFSIFHPKLQPTVSAPARRWPPTRRRALLAASATRAPPFRLSSSALQFLHIVHRLCSLQSDVAWQESRHPPRFAAQPHVHNRACRLLRPPPSSRSGLPLDLPSACHLELRSTCPPLPAWPLTPLL
jgi:hypothetical protein